MDFLALVEPQFAVPVVAVTVLAILVYMFGFQQTQEPSLQHLAVLHSAGKSKSSAAATKQKSQTQNANAQKSAPKGKDKVVANGHAGQTKEKEKVKPAEKANKENVKPQQAEQPTPKGGKKDKKADAVAKTEEIEGGDWIPALSRKDKKLRPKKEEAPDSPVTPKSKKSNSPKKENAKPVLKEVTQEPVEVAKVVTPAPSPSKDKKNKKPASPAGGAGAKKNLDEKQPQSTNSVVEAKTEAPAPDQKSKDNEVEKVAPPPAAATKGSSGGEPQSNVAFDEMGELWEEAKSRGAKKNRARKDN